MGQRLKAGIIAVGAGLIAVAAVAGTASAHPAAGVANSTLGQPPAVTTVRGFGHGGGGFGRGGWGGGWHGGWGGPRFGLYYGGPYYDYASPYYYNDPDCGYLHHRAVETGSRYWWRRYRACIG